MSQAKFAATLVVAASLLPTAYASAETDEGPWSGDVEVGYVKTTGNTEEKNFKARAEANYEQGHWRNRAFFDSLNNSADDQRTAEQYFVSDRLGYQFNEHDYAFLFASYNDDRFSGYDFQATAAAGYGRRLLNEQTMSWDVEAGPGYRYSKSDDPTDRTQEELILRLFTQFQWQLTETTAFEEDFSTEIGDDNTITKSITSLRVKINSALALKLSYTIKHQEEVPPGKDDTDTQTAITLSYAF